MREEEDNVDVEMKPLGEDKQELYYLVIELLRDAGVTLKDGKLHKKGGRAEYLYTDFISSLWEDETFTPSSKDFKDAIEAWVADVKQASANNREKYPVDIDVILKNYMQDHGYYLDRKGILLQRLAGEGHDANLSEFKNALYLYIHRENNRRIRLSTADNPIKTVALSKELLEAAYTTMVRDRQIAAVEELRNTIRYDPNSTFPIDQWVDDMFQLYGITQHPREDRLMFKQMLWTIKRHLYNQEVVERFMIVFYSPKQRIGKTLMCKELNQLWSSRYVDNASLSHLASGKEMRAMLQGKVAADFQELAGAADEEIGEHLKAAITTLVESCRENYASTQTMAYTRTQFLASSNLSVSDVFRDSTGMRRFWEFEMQPTVRFPADVRGELFSEQNIIDLYRCINNDDPDGYYCIKKDYAEADTVRSIQAIQDTYSIREDKVSMFLRRYGIEIYNGYVDDVATILAEGYAQTKFSTFTKRFDRWMTENNFKRLSSLTLRHLLKNRYYYIGVVTDSRGGEEEVIYTRNKVTV